MENPDYLVFAMASGETSQAYSIVKHFVDKGRTVNFVIGQQINEIYFQGKKNFTPINVITTAEDFISYVKQTHPKRIIFCNSKSFKREKFFLEKRPEAFNDCEVHTLDSNWLFNFTTQRYPFIPWADRYFVNLPNELFQSNVKKNGGYFYIPEKVLSRIETVGFIPSYPETNKEKIQSIRESIGISPNEKMIFCYFSGYGAATRPWVLMNALKAVNLLHNDRIKIVTVGNFSNLDEKIFSTKNIINVGTTNLETYYELLSASDLIFQHQGLATMAQGIAANIPIIANVTIYPSQEYPALHKAEVKPFQKFGLCEMFYKTSSIKQIAHKISELLFDSTAIGKMKEKQKQMQSFGEENLLQAIEKLN